VRRIGTSVRDYDWGSTEAVPLMWGWPVTGRPVAEVWVGAHPHAPSDVHDGTDLSLDRWLQECPPSALGDDLPRFGRTLPFLLKVLAAERPLSIQVHPTREQAKRRFVEEEAGGLPSTHPQRTYRDAEHKPETLLALTPFEVLCGFREPAASRAALEALAVAELAPLTALLAAAEADRAALAGALRWVLELEQGSAVVVGATEAARARTAAGTATADDALLLRLATTWPGDRGVLAALLLRHLVLAPGEAVHLPAGNVHAYLRGTGVEVMASSDNVVRGGLTNKHVDVAEFLDVADCVVLPPPLVRAVAGPIGESVLRSAAEEFELAVHDLPAVAGRVDHSGLQVVLCVSGRAEVVSSRSGEVLALAAGEAALVTADDGPVELRGDGLLVRATTRSRTA